MKVKVITTENALSVFLIKSGEMPGKLFSVKMGLFIVFNFEKLGFKVYGINGWKALRGEHAYLKFKPTLLWIIISDITQQLVFRKPKQAFHLYAIKELP
jgi:hypothetical protein